MITSFKIVLDIVISELKAMSEVKSILFFGSVQQGNPTPTSDIDLFAIVEGDETWNYRRIINGIEVEVYFLPYRLCIANLENGDVTFIKAFSTGTPLLDENDYMTKLSERAKQLYAIGPKPLDLLHQNNIRIRLSDLIKDLEGLPSNTPESRMLASSLVSLSLDAYCKINQVWSEKSSRLIRCISTHNPKLGEEVTQFFMSLELNPTQAISIADSVLEFVGGRLLEYEGPRIQSEGY